MEIGIKVNTDLCVISENLVSGKRTRSAAQSTSSVKQQVTSSTSQKKRKHEDMDAASDSTGKLTAKYAKASGRPKGKASLK